MENYPRPLYKNLFTGLLIFFSVISFSAFADSFTYESKFRSAEDLKAAISPFLEGAKVAALNYKMVIEAPPEKLAEIKALLAELDKGLRQLTVQVKAHDTSNAESENIEVTDPLNKPSVSGTAVSEKNKRGDNQLLTVSEGQDAFIATEKGGFNATIRVSGKIVVLDIYQQVKKEKRNGVSHSYNALKTSIHGQLDTWIDLGQIENSVESKSTYTVGAAKSKSDSLAGVSVRVQLAK